MAYCKVNLRSLYNRIKNDPEVREEVIFGDVISYTMDIPASHSLKKMLRLALWNNEPYPIYEADTFSLELVVSYVYNGNYEYDLAICGTFDDDGGTTKTYIASSKSDGKVKSKADRYLVRRILRYREMAVPLDHKEKAA